jgi:putative peptidoglycan lipid II flippase
LIAGIGALSLSTAVLPHFSRMVARKDIVELRTVLRTYNRLILLGSIPIVGAIVYWSRPLVAVLFHRGAFSDHDVDLVSRIQAANVLQVPMYLLGILQVRVITSFSANQVLFAGAWLNLAANVGCGYTLAKYFGAVGVGLVAPVVYLVSWLFLAYMAGRLLNEAETEAAAA